jgi:hypothetical protein
MGNITCADSDILLTKCINYNLYKLNKIFYYKNL